MYVYCIYFERFVSPLSSDELKHCEIIQHFDFFSTHTKVSKCSAVILKVIGGMYYAHISFHRAVVLVWALMRVMAVWSVLC